MTHNKDVTVKRFGMTRYRNIHAGARRLTRGLIFGLAVVGMVVLRTSPFEAVGAIVAFQAASLPSSL